MSRWRDPRWILIFLFLGIMTAVPLTQIVIEARQEQGVRLLEIFSQAPTAENLRAYEKSLESANWAGRLSRSWIQFAQFAWLKNGGDKAVIGKDGWYFYKPGLKYMLDRPSKPKPGEPIDAFGAIVDFRDQLAKRGIQLVVMPVPDKETIYPDRLIAHKSQGTAVLAPRTRELLQKLRQARVEVLDLFSAFGEARRRNDATSLYLAQDTHWSPAGVDLAAKLAARRLLQLGWMTPGQTSYLPRESKVERSGDILRMLQTPRIERYVGRELVSAVQVIRADNGELYQDAADAEVLVLGDSFMRIYQQDAPTGAGFIAHLSKELQRPMISLVNDGGGSSIVREELRGRPPFLKGRKVVLWEFVERDIGLGLGGWKLVAVPPP